MRKNSWTSVEDDRLRAMRGDKVTYPEISMLLGRSAIACQARAQHLGITEAEVRWTPQQDDVLRHGVGRHLSYDDIVSQLREIGFTVSRSACVGRAHRIGLRKPNASMLNGQVTRIKAAQRQREQVAATPQAEETPLPPGFLGIAFLDLDKDHCRFPRGEGANILFCGQPKMEDSSYCPGCHRITHIPRVTYAQARAA